MPPFPASEARGAIEAGLGAPIGELFAELEDTPLGAASIAQVHRARLPDGRDVVVKVRRPGIREAVWRDMHLLRRTLRVASLVLPPLRRLRVGDLLAELEANLLRELDFREEARNIRRFAEAFAGSETVYVPEAVSGMVREDVLVQAMSGGRRVDDASLTAEEGRELVEAFLDAHLRQFFVLGVFHGDPHPGNLFIRDDGRICFRDFGLVGPSAATTAAHWAASCRPSGTRTPIGCWTATWTWASSPATWIARNSGRAWRSCCATTPAGRWRNGRWRRRSCVWPTWAGARTSGCPIACWCSCGPCS